MTTATRIGPASRAGRARYRLRLLAPLMLGAALSLGAGQRAQAQDTLVDDWEFTFKNDNDTLLNTDRYYTNGLRLTALKVRGDHWFGWALANETYTSSNIRLTPDEISPDDHPYAGWTYLSFFRGRLDGDGGSVVWEFTSGCLGPCSRAERFQRYWHSHVVDAPEPQGWSTQIQTEIGVQVRRVRQKPLRHWLDADGSLTADLERTTEFRIGNINTDASIGVVGRYRLGNMRGFYDGAGLDDMTPKRPLELSGARMPEWVDRPGRAWFWADEAFVFGRIEGSLVAHNSTIEGGIFNDNSPFTQDIRHAVIRTEIGVKFVWRRISFAVSWNSTSTDFRSRPWALNHHNWLSFYGVVH